MPRWPVRQDIWPSARASFPRTPRTRRSSRCTKQDVVTWQEVLNRDRIGGDYYTGSRQGRLAVLQRFVASGIHHIAIGPDHILFLVGLLIPGGRLGRLLGIVTAFTVGHSITLALATLSIVSPPGARRRAVDRAQHRLRRRRQPVRRPPRTGRAGVGGPAVRPHPRVRVRERAARHRLARRGAWGIVVRVQPGRGDRAGRDRGCRRLGPGSAAPSSA